VAPRQRKPAGPTPVDAIKHAEKRTNIPTADAQDFVAPEIEAVRKVRYDRDESLDPQLVWKGKYPGADAIDGYDDELITDAPPIYIQEKIDARVIVENLRRTAAKPGDEPELTLFETFDGIDGLDAVDFYKHDANWSNRMILGDSLQVMASLAEREHLRGKVQMVYIDPPYGIRFGSNWQVRVDSRDVKDGNLGDAAREAEQIKAFRDTWELGIHSYLSYMRDRLIAARELLTESGSCFVQIGDENVHLVRNLLDEVFGSDNLVALITTQKTSSSTGDALGAVTDYVLWFAKDVGNLKYRPLFRTKEFGGSGASNYNRLELSDGTRRPLTGAERADPSTLPVGSRPYAADNLTSQSMGREKGEGAASWFVVDVTGDSFDPGPRARWKTNESGMDRLLLAGRAEPAGRRLAYVRFIDDFPAYPLNNIWTDTVSSFMADKLYVVQTNTKVIERCMLMCSDPGDLVLDPTCGSGTTAFVAEEQGRRWITIDTSRVALALARQRLMGAKYPWYLLADSADGHAKEQSLTAQVLPQQQFADDIRRGFVYERVQHITLKSIANNPDIKEGMSREEIDAAIKRHADFEVLYDKPYEDRNKVRVTGPFTVESLSPHRSLAFTAAEGTETIGETEAAKGADAPNFEQSILDNLTKAGIQNGRKQERIKFASFETYAGQYIQAVGERAGDNDGHAPSRIGVAIGPQYGTVSASFVKNAAREALQAEDIDLLAVLGFAFDPQVNGLAADDYAVTDDGFASVAGERKMGRIPVLIVRMNVDLLMGEELKKTGAGNLFTVFGEPDIEVTLDGVDVTVEIRGVDVYDPTTGDLRSKGPGEIALWMIDTDYNEESFFVRHCYFTGDNDPYRRLKTALKADIDEDAWASLNKTVSRPFVKPSTGKIAVKVINDYGDEVMKVIEV
jgi:adenine-specific DNA-methyltransferase